VWVVLTVFAGAASATPATKLVRYRGFAMRVPARWPVFRITRNSTVCVRFNRHAVYLGSPSSDQRCPAHAVGRTEAILVTPITASTALHHGSSAPPLPPLTVAGARPAQGSEAQFLLPARGIEVTATWARRRGVVARALGLRLGPRATASAAGAGGRAGAAGDARTAAALRRQPLARAAVRAHAAGAIYAGLGVDACSAPNTTRMAAWGASPYHALGVYIGGTNMACSQPNLTAAWVAQEWAAGWHLIPTYVGLQAPGNSCGCAAISASQAAAQGVAAAVDAVIHAQAIGIGAGNPIYDDMESYSAGGTATTAVLAFLQGWATQLHAEGYLAGVYSSTDSGIPDLVSQATTGYVEPDDIWLAHWNGLKSTSDPAVPSLYWADNQRIHQYRGGHNETYGGVTINVDNDYLDGATAFAGGGPLLTAPVPTAPPPSLRVSAAPNGTIGLSASWPNGARVAHWRVLGGPTPAALVPLVKHRPTGGTTTIAVHSAFPYYAAQALGRTGQVEASSATVATAPHVALYGRSVFVPSRGLASVPAGCFTGSMCQISLTVRAGKRLLARTGREFLGSTAGMIFFKLSPLGRSALAHAPGRRLRVALQARDVSGATATTSMNLIPFVTTGRGPRRSAVQASTVRISGLQDFVWLHTFGGILAGCVGSAPCRIKLHLTANRRTIATAAPGTIGANEAGYLMFRLNRLGGELLANARGNQLGARLTLTDASVSAQAHIVLSSFY
jgi:hypothetical protein